MKKQINFNKTESQLIASMSTKHMGFTKEELIADHSLFQKILRSDYDRFTICWYMDKIKQETIDKYNLTEHIQSVKEKLGQSEEVA